MTLERYWRDQGYGYGYGPPPRYYRGYGYQGSYGPGPVYPNVKWHPRSKPGYPR